MLSAIMASTKVENCARKPGWRSAAKDRPPGDDAAAWTDFISFIESDFVRVEQPRRDRPCRTTGDGSSAYSQPACGLPSDRAHTWRDKTKPPACFSQTGGSGAHQVFWGHDT